jgi:hypothetical protein
MEREGVDEEHREDLREMDGQETGITPKPSFLLSVTADTGLDGS